MNNIKEELPKNQVFKISRGYITDTDYKNGIGKNDICAVILFTIVVLNSDISDIFLIELKNCLQIYNQIVFHLEERYMIFLVFHKTLSKDF